MLRASNRTPYRAWGKAWESGMPRSCPGSVPQFPRASPLLQGLSSPTHSLSTCGNLNFGSREAEWWKIPGWHYGWVCAKHRAEPDTKESKTANAWLSSHSLALPFWITLEKFHQHTSVTSHGVCTWIIQSMCSQGLTTLRAKIQYRNFKFLQRN